ncbi:MAG: glycosyltransferase [Pseudomonadota bacterium]
MNHRQPLVSVILCTFNRPWRLGKAIRGVTRQTLASWELLVINDGGLDVGEIVRENPDERIQYHQRPQNQGKAACCNFGIELARGKYVAYLDDDDAWAPRHLEILTEALEKNPEYGAAYSDLHRTAYILDRASGQGIPVSRSVSGSRDFIRELNFHVNIVPHVSLLHRRDLARRAGGYDPEVTALIDWNISRKLSYLTDILHVSQVTGEFWAPLDDGASQRISDVQRRDREKFRKNACRIRADHPPKPWPKVAEVAVVFPALNPASDIKAINELLDGLHYPVEFVIVDAGGASAGPDLLRNEFGYLKNVKILTPPHRLTRAEAVRRGIESAGSRYILAASTDMALPLYANIFGPLEYIAANPGAGSRAIFRQGWDRTKSAEAGLFAAREVLLRESSPVPEILIERPIPRALLFDAVINDALTALERRDWRKAADAFLEARAMTRDGRLPANFVHRLAMVHLWLEEFEPAEDECRYWLSQGVGGDVWVDLGLLLQGRGEFGPAASALERGLNEIGFRPLAEEVPDHIKNIFSATPAFRALIGLGACWTELGRPDQATAVLSQAARLLPGDSLVHQEFGRLFLRLGRHDQGEKALLAAVNAGVGSPETFRLLGELCEKKGRVEDAYSFYQHAVEMGGGASRALGPFLASGLALNRAAELKKILTEFLAVHPRHARATELLKSLTEPREPGSDGSR